MLFLCYYYHVWIRCNVSQHISCIFLTWRSDRSTRTLFFTVLLVSQKYLMSTKNLCSASNLISINLLKDYFALSRFLTLNFNLVFYYYEALEIMQDYLEANGKWMVWFRFVQWHINLRGLFISKAILVEEQQWHYSTHSWGR